MNTPISFSPATVLGKAIQAVPAVKYALGVAGVIAVIAIVVGGWQIDPRVAIIGFIVIIILMTILAIFSNISSVGVALSAPLLVIVWTSVILFVLTGFSLFGSVVFDWPIPLRSRFFNVEKKNGTQTQPQKDGVQSQEEPKHQPNKSQGSPPNARKRLSTIVNVPGSIKPFEGTWESDEMDNDPIKTGNDFGACLFDATKKIELDTLEASPNRYSTTLTSTITIKHHTGNGQDPMGREWCNFNPLNPDRQQDIFSKIAAVSSNVLSIQTDYGVMKFKRQGTKLLPLPGAFDKLVSNTNRATFVGQGEGLRFWKRD